MANKYTDGAIEYKPNKKIKFNFDKKKVKFWLPKYCPILGIELKAHSGRDDWNKASVDRIDNNRGYDVDNIAVVSYRANSYKRNAGLYELWLVYINNDKLINRKSEWVEV